MAIYTFSHFSVCSIRNGWKKLTCIKAKTRKIIGDNSRRNSSPFENCSKPKDRNLNRSHIQAFIKLRFIYVIYIDLFNFLYFRNGIYCWLTSDLQIFRKSKIFLIQLRQFIELISVNGWYDKHGKSDHK